MLGPELMDSYVFDGTPNVEVVYLNGNTECVFHLPARITKIAWTAPEYKHHGKAYPRYFEAKVMSKPRICGSRWQSVEFLGLEALGGSLKTLILRNNNLKELHKSVGQLPLLE